MKLIELAERCEAADAVMQGALIEEAWEVMAEASAAFRRLALSRADGFNNNAARFGAAMDARAYESAALMLVPDGYDYALGSGRRQHMTENGKMPWAWVAKGEGFELPTNLCLAATPALALCAAALRARASMEGE